MKITKEQRRQVYDKFGGHCAYCGKEIAYKEMQIDHVEAQYLGGSDDVNNLMPACRACNFRKQTFSVEQFRQEIKKQCDNLCKTFQARMSLSYGLIERIDKPIIFYFERKK